MVIYFARKSAFKARPSREGSSLLRETLAKATHREAGEFTSKTAPSHGWQIGAAEGWSP